MGALLPQCGASEPGPNFLLLSTHYELGALPAHSTGQETGGAGRQASDSVLTLAEAHGWGCRDGGIDLLGGAELERDSIAYAQPTYSACPFPPRVHPGLVCVCFSRIFSPGRSAT